MTSGKCSVMPGTLMWGHQPLFFPALLLTTWDSSLFILLPAELGGSRPCPHRLVFDSSVCLCWRLDGVSLWLYVP